MNYTKLASKAVVAKTVEALVANGMATFTLADEAAALAKIKELIPQGASVMNGASTTLDQIGFIDYLKSGSHGWNNLHAAIVAEKNPDKQAQLRKQSLASDFYLGSVHALAQIGEFVIASNTGSQLPNITYGSKNLIFVVGTQKIVPNLAAALKRLEAHVVPQEDVRSQKAYGVGTQLNKILIFKHENNMSGRKIHFILVNKVLGF